MTLVSRVGSTNLSNMPAISEELLGPNSDVSEDVRELAASSKPEEKWKITKFATTPPMSSYIVAWANGYFEKLESTVKLPVSGKELPLRIFGAHLCATLSPPHLISAAATKDNIHQAQFALDVKAKVLPLYEQVFEVGYPLPKLDTLVVSLTYLGPTFFQSSFLVGRLV